MKEVHTAHGRRRLRLETWGEIANHLGVEVRTSQRWEVRLQLPVRRLEGSLAVFAFADELDDWRTNREVRRTESENTQTSEDMPDLAGEAPNAPAINARPSWVWVAVALSAAAAAAILTFQSPLRARRRRLQRRRPLPVSSRAWRAHPAGHSNTSCCRHRHTTWLKDCPTPASTH